MSKQGYRVLINFFIGVPFLHFYTGFEMIGRECIISLPLMESGEI